MILMTLPWRQLRRQSPRHQLQRLSQSRPQLRMTPGSIDFEQLLRRRVGEMGSASRTPWLPCRRSWDQCPRHLPRPFEGLPGRDVKGQCKK